MAKLLCVTNVTGLLLASFVVIFSYHQYFLVFYKKICLKKGEVWRKVISTKLLSRLSQKVCRLLFSSVLLRKLPIISVTMRVISRWSGCHGYSRAALRLPPFAQAPSPHPSTDEAFNQGLATSCFLPLEFFCQNFQVCLSSPNLYSQPSFIIMLPKKSVHEF